MSQIQTPNYRQAIHLLLGLTATYVGMLIEFVAYKQFSSHVFTIEYVMDFVIATIIAIILFSGGLFSLFRLYLASKHSA